MCYQGGYLAFLFVISFASFALAFFAIVNTPFVKRTFLALKKGAAPILTVVVMSCLMAPFQSYNLFKRSIETAGQTEGWRLSLLNPWSLSAIPYYQKSEFSLYSYDSSPLLYVLFIGVMLLIVYLITKNRDLFLKKSDTFPCNNCINLDFITQNQIINALTSTFIFSLLLYLIFYSIFGSKYQIWKFASFTALPLSFIFPALLALFIKFLYNKKDFIKLSCLILPLSIFIINNILNLLPLAESPKKIYTVVSARSYIDVVKKVLDYVDKDGILIFNLNFEHNMAFFMDTIQKDPRYTFMISNNHYLYDFFGLKRDFSHIINSNNANYFIISDRDYKGLFRGDRNEFLGGQLFIFESPWVKEHGYAITYPLNQIRNWEIVFDFFTAKIGLPEKLIGKPAKVKITLINDEKKERKCTPLARLGLHGPEGYRWTQQQDSYVLEGIAQPDITSNLSFLAGVIIDNNRDIADPNGKCHFRLKSIEVEESF
jgi:hypothetical protein